MVLDQNSVGRLSCRDAIQNQLMALETERLRKHDLYKKHRDYPAKFTFFNILTPPTALWSKNQMVVVSWKFQMEVYDVFQDLEINASQVDGSGIPVFNEDGRSIEDTLL